MLPFWATPPFLKNLPVKGVIRPILFPQSSTNHTLPSGPAMIVSVPLPSVGIGNPPVITPEVVILQILFGLYPTNQRLPSGPAVIPTRSLPAGTGNSVICP